jgi:predicted nucleic acid-binding protein
MAHDRRAWFRSLPIRLFGDAVLMRRAWEVADRLGWSETYDAEYVAVAQLHRATLVTLNDEVARSVKGIVPTASIDALR